MFIQIVELERGQHKHYSPLDMSRCKVGVLLGSDMQRLKTYQSVLASNNPAIMSH